MIHLGSNFITFLALALLVSVSEYILTYFLQDWFISVFKSLSYPGNELYQEEEFSVLRVENYEISKIKLFSF